LELYTDGNEIVKLIGKNFGPSTEFLNSVRFGPDGSSSYVMSSNACVVNSHEEIECISRPAVRSLIPLKWVVRVGD
jgi:hypothetical protein